MKQPKEIDVELLRSNIFLFGHEAFKQKMSLEQIAFCVQLNSNTTVPMEIIKKLVLEYMKATGLNYWKEMTPEEKKAHVKEVADWIRGELEKDRVKKYPMQDTPDWAKKRIFICDACHDKIIGNTNHCVVA